MFDCHKRICLVSVLLYIFCLCQHTHADSGSFDDALEGNSIRQRHDVNVVNTAIWVYVYLAHY